MRMISLCSTTFDLQGALLLEGLDMGRSELQARTRRVSRTPTLDGGVYIQDGGFADGDRTLRVSKVNPSEAEVEALQYLVETYSELSVVHWDRAFIGVIQNTSHSDGRLEFNVMVRERASA